MNINGLNMHLKDDNFKHFQTLPKLQQEAIKQRMILYMLQNNYE
jgi:hypothetical protein